MGGGDYKKHECSLQGYLLFVVVCLPPFLNFNLLPSVIFKFIEFSWIFNIGINSRAAAADEGAEPAAPEGEEGEAAPQEGMDTD